MKKIKNEKSGKIGKKREKRENSEKSGKSEKGGKVEKGGKSGKREKGGCTCIMNVAASKVSFGMHNMSASEASPCVHGTAGPPQELEFGARSALKFQLYYISSAEYLSNQSSDQMKAFQFDPNNFQLGSENNGRFGNINISSTMMDKGGNFI